MLQIGLVLVFQGKPGWDIPLEYSLLGTNSIVWHVNTSQHSMKSWEPQGSSGRSAPPCEFHLGDKTTFQGFPKSPFLQFGISARNSRGTLSSCWCCPSFSLCLPPFPAPSPSSGISTGSHPAFLLHPTTNPSRKKKGMERERKINSEFTKILARTPPLLDFHVLSRNYFPDPHGSVMSRKHKNVKIHG